ncbi:MAG: hypothetical protein ABIP51_20840 [Bacteroidia bacterium]
MFLGKLFFNDKIWQINRAYTSLYYDIEPNQQELCEKLNVEKTYSFIILEIEGLKGKARIVRLNKLSRFEEFYDNECKK